MVQDDLLVRKMKTDPKPSSSRSERRRRNYVIRIRMDDAEFAAIRSLATSNGMTVSSYARAAALKRPVKRNTTSFEGRIVSDLARVVSELKRLRVGLSTCAEQQGLEQIIVFVAAITDWIASARP
ncbi:MAG TPA: hypothetical protein VGZ02_17620 [Candidatus Baltobacteraceae bacterium]|nr:hypothetical protein [Candidatus Baltobacteraceae bacterium]